MVCQRGDGGGNACGVARKGSQERANIARESRQQQTEKSLKAAGKRLKLVGVEVVQRFSEELVSQLEVRIKDGDQSGFYKHFKGMYFEAKESCRSQYIKAAESSLVRDSGLIGDRWLQGCRSSYNTRSPALDPGIVEELIRTAPVQTSR